MVTQPLRSLGELKITSSFRIHAGVVDEITWTKEDDLLRYLKEDRKGYEATLDYRTNLRRAAKAGLILYRRHPEHGWWEYGPQWRTKEFSVLIAAGAWRGCE